MFQPKLIWLLALSLAGAVAHSQTSAPEVKHVPMKATSAASGQQMYKTYCAACHGTDGKGGDPAASALKVPPPDLTVLSKNNGGKFPSDHVGSVLNGTAQVPAHGSKEMPVWGKLFWSVSHGSSGQVQLRVQNLSKYIESLQEK